MATDFPTIKSLNDQITIGTKTYKWNGSAWDRYIAPVVSSTTEQLTATIAVVWDWGTSPTSDGVTPVYPNYPYDSNNKFIGDLLKGNPATYTVTWNIAPVNFSSASIILPYEPSTTTVSLFQSSLDGKTFTFSFLPTKTPGQVYIKKGSVSTSTGTTLLNDVYSIAIGADARPYIIPEIVDTTLGVTTYTIADDVNSSIVRKYVVGVAGTVNKQVKLNFTNFKSVYSAATTVVTSAQAFNATDIIASIFYSDDTKVITGNNSSNSNFYFNTTAYPSYADTVNPRFVTITNALGSNSTSVVMKFQVPANTYLDNGTNNIIGTACYLGLFNYNAITVKTIPVSTANSNVAKIKFKLNHYRALTTLDTTKVVRAQYGTLGAITADSSDEFGLTYVCEYTPSAVKDYYETITIPQGWRTIPVGRGFITSKSSVDSSDTVLSFTVQQSAIKYINSNLINNFGLSTINLQVDRTILALPAKSTVNIKNTSTAVNIVASIVLSSTTKTSDTLSITVPAGLVGSTTYEVIIPTTLSKDAYGNMFEDLHASSVTHTFTVDSTPVVPTISGIPTVANPQPTFNVTFNKAVTTITSGSLVLVEDITNASAATNILTLTYPANFTTLPVLSSSNTIPNILSYTNIFGPPSINPSNNFKINRKYQVKVISGTCKDRFNNTNVEYVSPFTITPVELTCTSTSSNSTAYSSASVVFEFSRNIIASNNVLLTLVNSNGTSTYTTGSPEVVISGTNITFTPTGNNAIVASSTYTITIASGFVKDYFDNQSTAYTTTFTTLSMGTSVGQQEFTATDNWTPPFGVNSVSIVAIGAGSYLDPANYPNNSSGAGSLAWINNISVIPGTSYTVTVGQGGTLSPFKGAAGTGNRRSSFNNLDVVAEGGTDSTTRAHAFISSTLTSNKVANTAYGTSDGGLNKFITPPNVDYPDHSVLLGHVGTFTNEVPGTDYFVSTVYNTSEVLSGNLLGTKIYPTSTLYGTPGSGYVQDNDGATTGNKPASPGVVYIIWGPGRSFPSTLTAPQ